MPGLTQKTVTRKAQDSRKRLGSIHQPDIGVLHRGIFADPDSFATFQSDVKIVSPSAKHLARGANSEIRSNLRRSGLWPLGDADVSRLRGEVALCTLAGPRARSCRFPRRCPRAPESRRANGPLRHLLYGSKPNVYRILFEIDEARQILWILTVRHGARDTLNSGERGKKES